MCSIVAIKKELKTNREHPSKTWLKPRKMQEVKSIRRRINQRKYIVFKFRFLFEICGICYTRDIGIILNRLAGNKLL